MSNRKSNLGKRMKEYEKASQLSLTRRTPVVIRLDGKAFHTFTRGFKKPFDEMFWDIMRKTTKMLCENLQNCVLGYTQSDEITLVFIDYYNLNTEVAYKNNVQKLCSISASMCTLYFNQFLIQAVAKYAGDNQYLEESIKEFVNKPDGHLQFLLTKCLKGAMFDARCFNIPKEDVSNCILWRQMDCYKNSISSIAQSMFSQKELNKKSTKERLKMCISKGYDWDNLHDMYKLGTFVIKDENGVFDFKNFDIQSHREEIDKLFLV